MSPNAEVKFSERGFSVGWMLIHMHAVNLNKLGWFKRS